ncbi:50S ribosomal protein L4 [Candidatus Bipolaricaulota bacterium]|nr:50S ribosomal protein L4 [Candidatus Bipolaricaulota bacterium]
MVEARLYSLDEATEPKTVELDEMIFDAKVNSDLLYRAVRTQLLGRRQGTSSTKTRGEARGGGRKPWRQKGTGRARAGSRRSPLWVGGGITFGPKPRSYDVKLPKKMRRGALISALSDRAGDGKVTLLGEIAFKKPTTKGAISLLNRLGISPTALVIVSASEYNRAVRKSFSNLVGIKCLPAGGLNVYDILRHDELMLTLSALKEVRERFRDG